MNKRAQGTKASQFVGDSGVYGFEAKGFATGCAKYVGRVGALAVALGIGTAVTGGYGIARADEPSAPSVESNVSSGEPADSGHHLRPHQSAITDLPHAFIAGVRGVLTGTRPDATAVRPRAHLGSRPDDGREGGETSRAGIPETVATQHDSRRQSPISPPRIARDRSAQFSRPSQDVGDPVDVARKIVEHVRDVVATPVSHTARSLTVVPAAANLVASQPTSQLTSSPAAHAPIRTVITGLLSVFDRGLTHGGGGPAPENPLLAAVLGFVRRFERTFGNEAPTTHLKQDEIVQVDGQHAVGYLDPTDADGDRVTSSYTTSAQGATGLHGTVAFDPATPGKFTYTAPADRDMTKEWTDTVTITTSDAASGLHLHGLFGFLEPGGGHTTAQTVVVKIEPIANPTVDVADGTVTGKVPNDTEALDYTVEAVDPKVGTVAVNRTTGVWTFTPTADARFAAGKTVGADPVPFTITAVDADGHQTPIQVTASIVPTSVSTITLPPNTTQSGAAVAGSDGSIVVTSYDQGNNATYVTVIGADGKAHLSDPLPGSALGNPVVNAQGTAYQATRDDSGAITTTYLSVISPNGRTISTVVPGDIQGDIVIGGEMGIAYATSVVDGNAARPSPFAAFAVEGAGLRSFAASDLIGNGGSGADDDEGVTTYVTAVGPDGTVYQSDALPGRPEGAVVVGADGTAYQTTTTRLRNPDTGGYDYKTYLTVLHTDGSDAVTNEFAGQAYRVVVDADGNAYQTSYDYDTSGTLVNVVRTDGTVAPPIALAGSPVGDGPIIGPDGTYYLSRTMYSADDGYYTSFLTTLTRDGTVTSAQLPGENTYGGPVVGSTGAVYQTSVHYAGDYSEERTYVTTVDTDGNFVDSQPIQGRPYDSGVIVAPDGTGYQVTSLYDPGTGKYQTYVTAIGSDGNADLVGTLPGSPNNGSTRFGPDGSVYQGTQVYGNTGFQSYANVIDAQGDVHTTLTPGDPQPNSVVIAPSGVIYQTTVNQNTSTTYLTGIGSDGTVRFTYAVDGLPANNSLVVGPDGTVYQTTYAYDPDAGTFSSYVSTVDADGVVRVSDPIPGDASSGVIFAAGGTPIQGTSSASYTLNPTSWTPHQAPVVNGFTAGSPAALDGAVTGTVNVTALDAGDTLHYELDPANTVSVTVDQNTGQWTYTPTSAERNAAYYGAGPTDVTFTIVVTDGGFITPVSVTAAIDPVADGETVALPAGASPTSAFVTDADGNAYQSSYDAATNNTYVTVIGVDGHAHTSEPLPGYSAYSPVAGAQGTTYQLTYDGANTYMNVVDANGNTQTTKLPGQVSGPVVIGPNGSAYETTNIFVQSVDPEALGPNDGPAVEQTFVTVVRPGGFVTTTDAIPGSVGFTVVFAPDGTAYQVTSKGGAANVHTYVTVIDDTGVAHPSLPIQGQGNNIVFGSGETPFVTTYDAGQLFVTAFDSAGQPHTSVPIPGQAIGGPVAALNGTVYQTTRVGGVGGTTRVTVVDPTGTVVGTPYEFNGAPGSPPVVDAAGNVYQTFVDTSTDQTYVAVIAPNGNSAVISDPIPGTGRYNGMHLGPNGVVYQVTDTGDTGFDGGPTYDSTAVKTYVTTIAANGDTVISSPITGVPFGELPIGTDGTGYEQTFTFVGGEYKDSYLTVIGSDATYTTHLPGSSPYDSSIVTGSDGTVYVLSVNPSSNETFVTTIDSDGQLHDSAAIPGLPAAAPFTVAPGGTLYFTTSVYDGVDLQTYVATLNSDGSFRLSQPLSGEALSGVVIGPGGTVYQSTDTATVLIDPSDSASWELHTAMVV